MFDISTAEDGTIILSGRLDASQEAKAREVFDKAVSPLVVDFKELDYIASAGLGILLGTQKKLLASGEGMKIVNINAHIREIFEMAGFHTVFELEG
jgi:anti-anti-sigma factor